MSVIPRGVRELLSTYETPRILDFGCGYGRSTSELIEKGYDVWGVDISADEVAKAPAEIRNRLTVLKDGRAPFADGHFDVLYSQQVFEHVADLEAVVAEIVRLTARGGAGVHEWPAKWKPVEAHLRMPLVHWLPKNGLRRAAIHGFTRLGVRPPWPPELPSGSSARELAEFEYRYSVNETFYRPFSVIVAAFRQHGFVAKPRQSERFQPLGPLAPAADWANRTFRAASLLTFAPH